MVHVAPEHTKLEGPNGLEEYVPSGKLAGKKTIVRVSVSSEREEFQLRILFA